jgi:uncharacterized protein YecT (DUF1311 family)
MPTIPQYDAQDLATLSAAQRAWLERQGRAARLLEARQRKSVHDRRRPRSSRRAGRALPPTPLRP